MFAVQVALAVMKFSTGQFLGQHLYTVAVILTGLLDGCYAIVGGVRSTQCQSSLCMCSFEVSSWVISRCGSVA